MMVHVNCSEEGVSSVVAIMLILVLAVTLFSVYSVHYLPDLKEESEIEHIDDVKGGFLRFSSDVEHLVQDNNGGFYGEPFSLGGGGVLLSPSRSFGTLEVIPAEKPVAEIMVVEGLDSFHSLRLAEVAYTPHLSFWESQGYAWECGIVNVTKGSEETPLLYGTMSDALNSSQANEFNRALLSFTPKQSVNQTVGNTVLDELQVSYVTISAGKESIASGDGMANLNVMGSHRDFEYAPDFVAIRVYHSGENSHLSGVIGNNTISAFSSLVGDCANVYDFGCDVKDTYTDYHLRIDRDIAPADIHVHELSLKVSAL